MFFYLSQTRLKTDMPNIEMVDMILAPLERVRVYNNLLTRLYVWCDQKHAKEYDMIGKASRRVGRLAAYIGKYEWGIRNMHEMNKAQLFLGVQHQIIVSHRHLIRYGPMIRR